VFNFDGYQVDQLGDRGSLYNASGEALNMATTFRPFLQAMKNAAPSKSLVMNAVNQYGQQGIAESPVDFLYTEVWGPNEGYKDLATIIQNNDAVTGNVKRTVLAAYMNYDLANSTGSFNTPGVLLTDAVIFAFGGSHLELGEHMLGKEYFPNSNLQMKPELKTAITSYYDFLVGYQNLLRDGGSFNAPVIACTNNKMTLNIWPPQIGQISVVGKEFANKQVLHFINFTSATHLNWRDANGTQVPPNTITDAAINFTSTKLVRQVWLASPDVNGGVAHSIAFTQSGNMVSFTLPSLKYWDMVVVEYQ
jgi:dextranase